MASENNIRPTSAFCTVVEKDGNWQ